MIDALLYRLSGELGESTARRERIAELREKLRVPAPGDNGQGHDTQSRDRYPLPGSLRDEVALTIAARLLSQIEVGDEPDLKQLLELEKLNMKHEEIHESSQDEDMRIIDVPELGLASDTTDK